jgi:hypothetical protein
MSWRVAPIALGPPRRPRICAWWEAKWATVGKTDMSVPHSAISTWAVRCLTPGMVQTSSSSSRIGSQVAAGSLPTSPFNETHWANPRFIKLYVLRRLLLGVVTLFLISIIVFAATQALPSDPARAILGRNATHEALTALRKQLHLDTPVVQQYTHWLRGPITGNLGYTQKLLADTPSLETALAAAV